MRLYDKIKELAQQKNISIAQIERQNNLANGTISKWNKSTPSADAISSVAKYLNVTTDYLLGNTPHNYYELDDKEKKDIAIQAEHLLDGIENGDNLNFYGEPATQDQKDRLLIAIRTAMEMNKAEAKKKFTRKDYRR